MVLLLLFAACGSDNRVGTGVDVNNIKEQANQGRLGDRTTTTAGRTSVPQPLGVGSTPKSTVAPTTSAVPRTTTAPVSTAPPTSRPPSPAFEIAITGDQSGSTQFQPSKARVFVGTTVRWTNRDTQPRSIVSDSGAFRSPQLAPGESFTYKAETAGQHSYHDGTRPYAVANVEVVPR